MGVRIYSTLSGTEEELVPLHEDGVLRMYVCGMTPKFHPHVGHARTFVAMGLILVAVIWIQFSLKARRTDNASTVRRSDSPTVRPEPEAST